MSAAVIAAKEKLDAESLAHERRGFVHDDVTRASWQEAYAAWMNARGEAGDAFALSLGYGPSGWHFDRWLEGHLTVRLRRKPTPGEFEAARRTALA